MRNTPNKLAAGSLATLTLTMALVFIAYFSVALAVPVLPLNVHQVLAAVPSWPLPQSLVLCDSESR
jgi:hypothetical protein